MLQNSNYPRNLAKFVGLLALYLLLSACVGKSPAIRYFLLQAPQPVSQATTTEGPLLGLLPIRLAPYLDRSQIVTLDGANRLRVADLDRWAEPLGDALQRNLTDHLSRQLGPGRVLRHPWPRSLNPDFVVEIHLDQLHVDQDRQCHLLARWFLNKGQQAPKVHETQLLTRATSMDFPAVVQAQALAVEQLGDAIATALRQEMQP
jgi:uncharacterized lipoprotein YmbA